MLDKTYVPPDLLTWDRRDREAEENMAMKMAALAKRPVQTVQEDAAYADSDTA